MGQESTKNQPNGVIMGNHPANSVRFDIYRANLSIEKGLYELELSNVIGWDNMVMRMTEKELKGLADFINKYLENN